MGVLGLWQLLSPVGQPVTLESLENKIFAVDISIWLNQALKGYRDSQGGSVPNAHLLSLFSRLCKLLFYKIRPIIVFDGGFPELKKQTIINRQKRRAAVKQSSRDVGLKVLTNYLASQQLGQVVPNSHQIKNKFKPKEKPRDEVFKLPPLPESSQNLLSESYESCDERERKFTNFSREDIKYLNQIDIESEDFNALPADVKQEILSTLKESRKHRTWDQYEELPKESNDFSKFQMQCLLKRRKLQSKLEEVQKDIRRISSSAYVSQYTSDHVIGETNKIMSDDISYYVLLKKIIEHKESDSDKSFDSSKPGTSVMADTKSAFIRDIENIDINEECSSSSEKEISSVSTKIKTENYFSDEEFDVDNPPLKSSDNKSDLDLEKNLFSDTDEVLLKNDGNDSLLESNICEINNPSSVCNISSDIQHQQDIVCLEYDDSIKNLKGEESVDLQQFKVHEKKQEFVPNSNVDETISQISSVDEKVLPTSNVDEVASNVLLKEEPRSVNIQKKVKVVEPEPSTFLKLNSNTLEKEPQNDLHAEISEESSSKKDFMDSQAVTDDSLYKSSSKRDFMDSQAVADDSSYKSSSKRDFMDSQAVADDSSYQSSSQKDFINSQVVDDTLYEANRELQENLDAAAATLEAEQAKQDRQSNTVQDHMIEECKELLQLFGIPYVVSPLEAEAQCAFYDIIDFTHGTITDDSDVWLFGGRRVFKNFFTQQKYVESYKDKEIFHHFGLSRKKLINFALLTGSDYTEGIEGVGPVTAMEIISEFPGDDIEALEKFKLWWEESNKHARPPENKVRAKLMKLVLMQNFPDPKVFDAYLNPEVDSSLEKFTWGRPDLDAIRDYAKERFGWNQSKVDSALLPILKKLNDRDKQMHLDSFFTVALKKQTNLFPSKRIMTALKKITQPQKPEGENENKSNNVKRKSKASGNKVIPKKLSKNSVSARGRGRKTNMEYKGPVLSESSDSDS